MIWELLDAPATSPSPSAIQTGHRSSYASSTSTLVRTTVDATSRATACGSRKTKQWKQGQLRMVTSAVRRGSNTPRPHMVT